ncbi:MAG: aldehyde dehydrogenase family protein [Pseudorhodoplanes sp.]
MTNLPRVTYSNSAADFSPLHDYLDRELPLFQSKQLGGSYGNIVGKDHDDRDGQAYKVASPIDSELLIGAFVESSKDAVDRAVAAASAAFPDWSGRPWKERVAILRKWASNLAERKYDIAMAALFEIGKSRIEAVGEAEEAVDLVNYYCDEMERNDGYRRPLKRATEREHTSSILKPLGVFAVIAPFNFPAALSVNMITGAILAGNTVVFKPSAGCGLSARLLVQALFDAGLPDGVVQMLNGGAATGRMMVEHPGIAGIAFTGSHAVGMQIARSALNGPYAKPVVAEMGGKNPAYVTRNADLAVAAQGVARSAFGLQGQKCSACSVAYVEAAVRDAFLDELKSFSAKLVLGDPRKRDVFMGPIYNKAAGERFDAAVSEARKAGSVVRGGEHRKGGAFDRGIYLEPTVVALDAPGRLSKEELFLPLVVIRTAPDLKAAVKEGNNVQYGLTAGVYTKDESELQFFLDHAEAGAIYANRASGATTGAWPGIQTFCGWKGSGVSHKGGLGPYFVPQFMREQSQTIMT